MKSTSRQYYIDEIKPTIVINFGKEINFNINETTGLVVGWTATRQEKPAAYYNMRPAMLTKYCKENIAGTICYETADQERKAVEKSLKDNADYSSLISVGDIFVASWGYSMTIVDWYQVISVKGQTAVLHEINGTVVEGNVYDSYKTAGVKDSFKGEPFKKRILTNTNSITETVTPYFKISDSQYAYKWDGKPMYENHND